MKLSWRQFWILLRCFQTRQSLPGASALAGVNVVTARRWYRRFQYHLPYEREDKLTGHVEIDEAFFGRRRYGNQHIVIGAYQRDTKHIVLEIIPNRSEETTDTFILNNIKTSSTVYTDSWSSYGGIDHFFGYTHKTCNHSKYIFGPTNHIEAVWSALKRWIRRSWQQVKAYLLPLFIREFEARNNAPELFETVENYLTNSLRCSNSLT
jgi:transposase-like protein